MKKVIIFTISLLILFLLALNIYVVTSRNSIKTKIESFEDIRNKISSLDSFRTNIVNLAHMQKSYLLTNEDSFKTEYSNYLNTSYTMLEAFLKNNTITNVDKVNFTAILDSYSEVNKTLLNTNTTLPLNKDMEDMLLKSNELQIELLHQVSLAIANNIDNSTESSNSITNSIDTQKSFIQIISSFFTLLISGPAYYLSKKYKNGELNFNGIFSSIKDVTNKKDDCSNMLAYATLLSNHNLTMEKQWAEVETLINLLQSSLSQLKTDINSLDLDQTLDLYNTLREIELQLIQIKLLIKQLPNYHQTIVQLSNNIINLQNK